MKHATQKLSSKKLRGMLPAGFLLAFTAQASGSDQITIRCETPADLDSRIVFCSDNAKAAQVAKACLAELDRAFQEAGPELQKFFDAEKGQLSLHQKKDFKVSGADHERARAKLTSLIDTATYNLHLMREYPPVMLDVAEEDVEDPSEHSQCFTENYEVVKTVVADLDRKVTELKRTRKVTVALKGAINVSESKLDNKSTQLAAQAPDMRSGKSDNGASDVTGIKESKAKGVTYGDGEGPLYKVAAQDLQKVRQSTESQITSGFTGRLAMAGNTITARAPGIDTNEAAQRDSPSVGGIFWQEPTSATAISLELKSVEASASPAAVGMTPSSTALLASASPAAEMGSGSLTSFSASSGVRSVGAVYSESTQALQVQASLSGISSDQVSLFDIVHSRYRATQQFRNSGRK